MFEAPMNKPVPDKWRISVENTSDIVDLCGLEPPEPIVKILTACAQLHGDDYYLARLPHAPTPLFPHLESRGLHWKLHEEADGRVLIMIRKTP